MADKALTYVELAQATARQITSNYRSWTAYLMTASRLYKYPYSDQLLIHAQRPDATACAEYDLWNNTMRRYVRRGSKGIALLQNHNGDLSLRYVFDVSDTGRRKTSLDPFVWSINLYNELAITAMLEQEYSVSGDHGLPYQLAEIAQRQAVAYWQDHQHDIFRIVDDSSLAEYDEINVGMSFRRAAAISINYTLQARCGLDVDSQFENEDFLSVFDWNTPDAVAVLGTAISQITGQILRQIERVAKAIERSLENDRDAVHDEGRLPDAEPDPAPAAEPAPEQVREDEGEAPGAAASDPVSDHAAEWDAAEPSAGDQPNDEPSSGADDAGDGDGGEGDGGTEGQRSDAVDAADERAESAGRGSPADGADLQLNFFDGSYIPSEAEQIQRIDEAERAVFAPFAFSVAQEDIDHILRVSDNTLDHRLIIVAEFSKQKSPEELAPLLARIYHGGYGIEGKYGHVTAWFTEEGVRLAHGRSARHTMTAQVMPWVDVAKRIGEMLAEGTFATNLDVAAALGYERHLLAQGLRSIIGNVSEKTAEQGYLPSFIALKGNTAPALVEQIEAMLADPNQLPALMEECHIFLNAYSQDRTLVRYRPQHTVDTLRSIMDIALPRVEFDSQMPEVPEVPHFITDDEIDEILSGGSHVSGGKLRIHEYFSQQHTEKERVDFLKHEYGTGGHVPAVSGSFHSGEWHDAKGIRLKKRMCKDVLLKWDKVAQRVDSLIRRDQYLNSEEKLQYLLCSLEVLDDQQQLKRKADMFTKRTIKQQRILDHVDTAVEALTVSISEKAKVDLPYMAQLSGKTEDELAQELTGVIFPLPETVGEEKLRYVTANEYLSGNVRQKLRDARNLAAHDARFVPNVEALETAQPKDLDASEIDVRLGATWVKQDYIQDFMYELLNTPYQLRRQIQVGFSPYTAQWNITGKSSVSYTNVAAYTQFGTPRANAYKILEDTLNLRDVRVFDTIEDENGKEKRVLNQKATTLAQQKQQAIKDAFRDWIWREPHRRHDLVRTYNERFNSIRPREFDGSHIAFVGMNPEITLREHQRNAVAHILYGGNTLLAHEVGAGKTFEMIAAVMESKRLGLCQKAMFVVPNHLTEQWASEFLRLYPSANILVTTKKDFERHNRQKFCSRIATGDYDAVIIGHSQFERIPVSQVRQERFIEEQIGEITRGIEELKRNNGEQFSIKQLVKTQKDLQLRLKKLQAEGRKDDVITFEQLGVDRLYVDEAHFYKNLFLMTKMRNVAGLSTSEAQKSSDMFAKCRYMDELTGGRGIVFATGTPVSNSMTELYTMQRYLQYSALQRNNMIHFDAWASTFGETVTAIELAPEGTGYRARTRFAKFFNLPELMTIFKEVADIKTADQLHLPTPKATYETVVVQPTEQQEEMVQALSERAAEVHQRLVDPSVDNMLKITSDGRKLGLDQRLLNPMLPDDPRSKVNACVRNIHRIWTEGADKRLTQMVFCDLSTPKASAGTEQPVAFSVYDDIRAKLIALGIPAEEIAFIHDANTEVRKKELFAKVRSGQVRVLMGSTQKMGAGTNCQDRLVALHDIDCPWRPGDLEQRAGRIVRQGNQNEEVFIYRYVTEKTFDAYLWQTVENKQKFISQIMTSKSPVRSCEDVDETALSYAEIKALCAGDPAIKEKMDLDIDVARLRLMKADHQSNQYRLEDRVMKVYPMQIEQYKGEIAGFQQDIQTLAAHPVPEKDFVGMEIKGTNYAEKEDAGKALIAACKDAGKAKDGVAVGHYRGLDMIIAYDAFANSFYLTLQGKLSHQVELGSNVHGNLIRIENVLTAIPTRLAKSQAELDNSQQQMAAAQSEIGKPFPQEDELQTKSARLAELNASLNMDTSSSAPADRAERTSVQEALKTPSRPGTGTHYHPSQEER